MSTLHYYYKNVIKQDLLTKFSYANLRQIPCFKQVLLSFRLSQSSLKYVLPSVSALILSFSQKPYLLTSNRANLVLKLKKGLPIGCVVVLRGNRLYFFLDRLLFFILPSFKLSYKDYFKIGNNEAFFTIKNPYLFKEVEKEYENFQELTPLKVVLISNTNKREEIFSLCSAFKLPVQK